MLGGCECSLPRRGSEPSVIVGVCDAKENVMETHTFRVVIQAFALALQRVTKKLKA
jgi:hypothetical protein